MAVTAGTEPWLVVVSGWTGAGKSTMAEALASELGGAVASFDWLMSALRSHEDVWSVVEQPVEFQRRVGWDLLARVAEQQLRGCPGSPVALSFPGAPVADIHRHLCEGGGTERSTHGGSHADRHHHAGHRRCCR